MSPTLAAGDVPQPLRRSLGEGCTPLDQAAADSRILLKREDAGPTGSHKDRAAAYQVAAAMARGEAGVVISSSGNAAIATSRYAELHGIPAVVFVHPSTDPAKLAAIDGSTTIVVVTPRAINGAKLVSRTLGFPNLRPSTHDDALIGYTSLGEELAAELPRDVDAVVLFATSGATAIAVAESLADGRPGVEVHFVQGAGNAGLVDPGEAQRSPGGSDAVAGRLGVRRSRRARQLTQSIQVTGGRGHVVDGAALMAGREALAANGITASEESAANMAVALELARAGRRVCCIVSGAPPVGRGGSPERVEAPDEHEALARVSELLA